jgi:ribosomal protein S18 acetylase RimI-like enzyme
MAIYPTLNQASINDIPFLTEVFLLTMRPHVTAARGQWNEVREREQFLNQLLLPSTSIIRYDGAPVGFLTAIQHPHHVELHTLCLLPEYQCHGLGSAVTRQLIADARNQNCGVNLSVLKSNPRAHVLYELLGFVLCSESEHHFHMRLP